MRKAQIAYSLIATIFCALLLASAFGITVGVVALVGSLALAHAYRKQQIAFMACGSATMNQIADPCNVPVGGQEVTVRIFNRADITSYTLASGNDYIVEAFVMDGAALGFRYKGLVNTNNFKTDMVELKFSSMWQTTGDILLFTNNGQTIKEMDSALAKGDLVVVVENKSKGTAGDAAFDVHGMDVGLKARKISRDPSSNDTQGAWVISLGPPKDQYETKPLRKFFKTSYAATVALLDGVTTPE